MKSCPPLRVVASAALLALLIPAARAAELPYITWQGQTMGSVYTVKIVKANLSPIQIDSLKLEVDRRLTEINRQMSHYQPESELSRFNRGRANVPFKVSPEFARATRFALDLARRSQGAFDPTLGPVINLWGFGEKTAHRAVPSEAALNAALRATGYGHLSITAANELVKDIPDLTINLSGVAKGFGVDQMAQVLLRHGFTDFYLSIAGEVLVRGHNPRGTPWQLGISAPISNWRENDPMAAVVSLSNQAISTSGDYQKFFLDPQGRRLSHIFDPRTGRPVQHNVSGVSVVAPDSMTADALGTTLFVLGVDQGLRFIDSCTNAAALFIIRKPDGTFQTIPSSRFEALTGLRVP